MRNIQQLVALTASRSTLDLYKFRSHYNPGSGIDAGSLHLLHLKDYNTSNRQMALVEYGISELGATKLGCIPYTPEG
jgi:hypothetical protein